MNPQSFFIHRTTCRVHTKKTQALCQLLKAFNLSLVTFNGSFTPQTLFDWFAGQVTAINMKHPKGRDLEVRIHHYNSIVYSFYDNPNNGEAVAIVTLSPVENHIDNLLNLKP